MSNIVLCFFPSTIGTFIYWSFFCFCFIDYWICIVLANGHLATKHVDQKSSMSDSSKHWQLVMDIIYINKMFVCVARVVFYVVLMVSLRRYMKVYVFSTISLVVIVALSVLHYIFYVMHPNLEQQKKNPIPTSIVRQDEKMILLLRYADVVLVVIRECSRVEFIPFYCYWFGGPAKECCFRMVKYHNDTFERIFFIRF